MANLGRLIVRKKWMLAGQAAAGPVLLWLLALDRLKARVARAEAAPAFRSPLPR